MNTTEHTELGNALNFQEIKGNPYLRTDEQGILHLKLIRFSDNHIPEPMNLELSAGEIIAMAGDFFTQKNWSYMLNLPRCEEYKNAEDLGKYLIQKPVTEEEQQALITAYNNLAAPNVRRYDIDTIYSINNSQYIPFSRTLNFYTQQLMYYLRVKDYGELLERNQTHFTPWSVRVYMLGHSIALRYAQLAFELKQLATNSEYISKNEDLGQLIHTVHQDNKEISKEALMDLAHRYQAQAYCIELFSAHYYTDHYASGHMAMVGELRLKLKEQFGTWGTILANNLHDELNRVGVFTIKPYDATPDELELPIRSRGDDYFDTCLNYFDKKACIAGLRASIEDIDSVLNGKQVPDQKSFGGLRHMLDVDYNSRQHGPLIVLCEGKIYHRKELSKIHVISPTEYEQLRSDPKKFGYKELRNSWDAFKLVTKLRLFPYIYKGNVLPLSKDKKEEILKDEKARSPEREAIEDPDCVPEQDLTVLDPRLLSDWRSNKSRLDTLDGLNRHSVLKLKSPVSSHEDEKIEFFKRG